MRRLVLLGFLCAGPALAQAPKAPDPATMSPADTWLPRQAAEIQVIDKVNAHAVPITLQVGQPAENGSLSIVLRNCAVRPPDLPQDSAAFLEIKDNRAGATGFRGWMFSNEPAVSMLESPIYDVRLVACR